MDLDYTGVPASDYAVFESARKQWTEKITADVVDVSSSGMSLTYACDNGYPSTIDDVYLCGKFEPIDGAGGILGSAGPLYVRSLSSSRDRGLPITGRMRFDSADIDNMKRRGYFEGVIVHEMGHILGIGTLWNYLGITGSNAQDCPYYGANANAEYQRLSGCTGSLPTELDGGSGTRCGHFDEECFTSEIMTGYVNSVMPFSNITLQSMKDMGYSVDDTLAEPITLSSMCTCGKRRNLRGFDADVRNLQGNGVAKGLESSNGKAIGRPDLSEKGRAVAVGYGKALLAQARAERGNAPDLEPGLEFVGDKMIGILYEENGYIYGVDVVADDA